MKPLYIILSVFLFLGISLAGISPVWASETVVADTECCFSFSSGQGYVYPQRQ